MNNYIFVVLLLCVGGVLSQFPDQIVPFSQFGGKFPTGLALNNAPKFDDDGVFISGPLEGGTLTLGVSSISKNENSEDSDAVAGVELTPEIAPGTTSLDAQLDTQGNTANAQREKAIAGTLFAVGNFSVEDVNIEASSKNNSATTVGGRAVSGSQNLFDSAENSDVTITNNAQNNQATAFGNSTEQDAISGTGNSFGVFENGVLVIDEVAVGNIAESQNLEDQVRQVVSGSVFGAGQIDGSYVKFNRTSQNNSAFGGFGTVVSGVQNNLNVLNNSNLVIDDTTNLNYAAGGYDADTISGTQSNFGTLQNSTADINSINTNNVALSLNNGTKNTIAGSQTNIGTIKSTNATINANNANNTAVSIQGQVISGGQINVGKILNSDVDVSMISENNSALTSGNNAIAGVNNNIGTVDFSNVDLDLIARENKAYVLSGTGNAIAGTDTVIGNVQGPSIVNINNTAYNNIAYADLGDAIAGSKVTIVNQAPEAAVNTQFQVANNTATSNNGQEIEGENQK